MDSRTFEYRRASWLPVRAGAAAISAVESASGCQAGAGLDLGALDLGLSALRRDAGRLGQATSFMLTYLAPGR